MKSLPAGLLKHKVIFQTCLLSQDGYNQETWINHFPMWAMIETSKTKEDEMSGQLMTESMFKLTCRFSNRISANHRILFKNRRFEIIGEPVNLNFENVVMEINIKELTDA